MKRARTMLLAFAAAAAGAGCGERLVGRLPDAGPPAGDAGTVDAFDAGAADLAPGDASGADRPPIVPDLPAVCTSEGWCWTHPLPTGDRLLQAAGIGADDLLLLGASGVILRFRGGAWSTLPPAPTIALSMWAGAADNVLVGGPDGPYHWDGASWTRVAIPINPVQRASRAMWGCAPDNVWVVGPVAFNWDGTSLISFPMPSEPGTRTVWGSSCTDVWAGAVQDASGAGRILHFDGSAWDEAAAVAAEQIVGTGPDDVWSLAHGQLQHWTAPGVGTLVDDKTLGLFPVGASAVGTMSDDRAVAVLARGGSATKLAARVPDGVAALWGRSASDIWGIGGNGVAAHWDGGAWGAPLPGWTLSAEDVVRVTGSGPTDLWAATSGGTLLHGNGSTWEPTTLAPSAVGGRIYDLWADLADDVWVLGGDNFVHRWNGKRWSADDPPPRGTTTPEMRAISGTGPGDVWILRGANSLLHWDGASWTSLQPAVDRAADVFAAAPGDVWVAGDDGVAHLQNGYWQRPRLPVGLGLGNRFTAVAGSGPGDVWVMTDRYVLTASTDGTELIQVMNSDNRVAALAPASAGGVWVLLQEDTTTTRLYFLTRTDTGADWSPVVIGPARLNDLWLAGDGTLWAGGAGGALVRRSPATAP